MIFTLKWKRPQERRVISERRWCQDRRIKSLPVDEDRRRTTERRSGSDRRSSPA